MRLVDKAGPLPKGFGTPADLEAPTSPGAPDSLVAPADLGAALVTNSLKGWQFSIDILFLKQVVYLTVPDPVNFGPNPSPVSYLEVRTGSGGCYP